MKVAIVGYGIEGKSALRYWLDKAAEVTIYNEFPITDTLPGGVTTRIGKGIFSQIDDGFDLVVRAPSILPDRIVTTAPITSMTQEFFAVSPAPIIGVTGTKGKGTVCSLVHAMLSEAGLDSHLVGNIGKPALDELPTLTPQSIVVFELSSFQLYDLQKSPHVAVVLMVEPEHLDVHSSEQDYIEAKARIVRWQGPEDVVVYHPTNHYVGQIVAGAQSHKIPFGVAPGAYVQGGHFWMDDQKVCSIEQMKLVGQHNLDNVCAAITVAWQYMQDIPAITRAIAGFKGLDHRLKFVRQFYKVDYYDDSIGTTPGSAIAALRSFAQPKVIILGGSDKGADFSALAAEVAQQSIRGVILIGQMRQTLRTALEGAGVEPAAMFDSQASMKTIVARAAELARPGDVVILSPACASFDMFHDYKDRGDQFVRAVEEL